LPSMGSVADAFDNALAESFISTLKRELLHRHSWPSRERVRVGIFEYIECFYNPRRRLTAGCGDIDPYTPCICERLSTPTDEGYARIMLRGSTTLETAVGASFRVRESYG
jgi:hypothetical protein